MNMDSGFKIVKNFTARNNNKIRRRTLICKEDGDVSVSRHSATKLCTY